MPDESADDKRPRAVGTAWALTPVANGQPLQQATDKYRDEDDTVAKAAIEALYSDLGISDPDAKPAEHIRKHATQLLDGYELRHPLFG
jgi:hypothetical protein